MKKVTIKKGNIVDFLNILDIQKNDGFKHAYYLDKLRYKRLISRGEIFYMALDESDNALGFISVDYEVRAKLHFMSVRKKYQYKGVGSRLLDHVLADIKKKGYENVYIFTEPESPVEKYLIRRVCESRIS